jgi:hypothetical protein
MGRQIMATKLVHNVETGEVKETVLTAAEVTQQTKDKASNAELQAELKAAADAKSALLKRLGITAEEAVLLLS